MAPNLEEVRQRLTRWQRTGNPHDLWPGLLERDFRRAVDEIGQVTRSVLQDPDGAGPLDCRFASAPRALGVAAFASGMGPLLGHWAETGRVRVDPQHGAVLAEHLAHGRARAQRLDAALGRVLDGFAERHIPAVVLKGLHTAWEYFPEPGTRPSADVDLLVVPQHLGQAGAALASLGYRKGPTLALDGSREDWFPPDTPPLPVSLEITHRDDPWHLDLHASLDRTLRFGIRSGFGSFAPEEGVRLERGGRTLRVLPQPLLLAWLAFHASSHLDAGPMIRYVELVLVMRRDFAARPELWERFLELSNRTSAAWLAYPALELAERLAPGSVPADVRRRLRRSAPWLMRRVVARLKPEGAQQLYRRSLDVRIMWVASWAGLLALLRRALRARPRGVIRTQLRRLRLLVRGKLSIRARR